MLQEVDGAEVGGLFFDIPYIYDMFLSETPRTPTILTDKYALDSTELRDALYAPLFFVGPHTRNVCRGPSLLLVWQHVLIAIMQLGIAMAEPEPSVYAAFTHFAVESPDEEAVLLYDIGAVLFVLLAGIKRGRFSRQSTQFLDRRTTPLATMSLACWRIWASPLPTLRSDVLSHPRCSSAARSSTLCPASLTLGSSLQARRVL